jgi:hypothetical protein
MTEPSVTGAPPAVTCAVSRTCACQEIAGEERVRVVTVGGDAACAAIGRVVANASKADEISLEFRPIQIPRIAFTKLVDTHVTG